MAKKDERYCSPVARMKSDYAFRTFVTAGLSFAATLVFACYNTFLGIFYGAAWNFGSFAAVNFKKTRKLDHLSVIMLRNASFIDALVSVLSLQYVLIMTFGKDGGSDMVRMVAMTSFAIWSAIVLVSALAVVRAVKLIKRK